ncbi:hypothetical protein [Chryseobacterium echinoideorum]|uniref:hypothetical protein n=1 Tax=Chryseobacterium echinoideorum TaxID=1549648 RepID=UPI001184CDBB|nr:hypothetical protein [Chryseobacterium echinoideorum]
MKKKFLIGALGLASVFAMTSATDENAENGRKFWGKEIVDVVSCTPSGQNPDGTTTYTVTYEVEYYVFWVGVSTTTQTQSGMSDCGIPKGCISC